MDDAGVLRIGAGQGGNGLSGAIRITPGSSDLSIPTLPPYVTVGAATFKVIVSEAEVHRLDRELNSLNRGICDRNSQTIYIDPSLPYRQQLLTLWHEVLHALLFMSRLSDGELKGKTEEQVVMTLESPSFCLIRDNPELIAAIQACKGAEALR